MNLKLSTFIGTIKDESKTISVYHDGVMTFHGNCKYAELVDVFSTLRNRDVWDFAIYPARICVWLEEV